MAAEPILEELVLEIMVRLPAKSIGRFRSVSKQWLLQTSDPKFIRTHASLAPVSGFFLQYGIGGPAVHFPLDDTCRSSALSDPSLFFLQLASSDLCLVSSSNGLILIHSAYKGEGHLLSVCNPTTKEHHVVSLPQQPHLSNLHLAFDPSRSAYFQVTGIGKIQDAYKIQIYSSGTLSLKAVDGVDVDTADLLCRCRCVYWNGYFVYLDMGLMDSPFYLLDVGGECLGRLPRPRKEICMYFGESGGRLHFIARPETGTSFDVMEMEAKSTEWSVLCRVDIGHIRDVYPEVDRNVRSFNLNEASIWDVYPEVDMDNRPFFGTNKVSTVYFMKEDRNGGDQLLLSIPGKIVAFHIRNESFTTVCHVLPSKSTYSCNQFDPHAHTLFSLEDNGGNF